MAKPAWVAILLLFLGSFMGGDNLIFVPDLAGRNGNSLFPQIMLAYLVTGSVVYGLAAWLGSYKGLPLDQLCKVYWGERGLRSQAVISLMVAIPACALTGGYFAGLLLEKLWGVEWSSGALLSLGLALGLACAGTNGCVKKTGIIFSLTVVAVIMVLAGVSAVSFHHQPVRGPFENLLWPTVAVMVAFNSGGIMPQLVTEVAARYYGDVKVAVTVAMGAKIIEGVLTGALAWSVVRQGAGGPAAVVELVQLMAGDRAGLIWGLLVYAALVVFLAPILAACAIQMGNLLGSNTLTGYSASLLLILGGLILGRNFLILVMTAGVWAGPLMLILLWFKVRLG